MTALTTAELILAALLALIVLTLAFIWLRRKVIARGHDLILGAIRSAWLSFIAVFKRQHPELFS